MPLIAIAGVLVASLLYAMAVAFLKRATQWQPGPWRVAFICNWATTLLFAPLWFFGTTPVDWQLWWQPCCVAVLFVGGQVLVVVALSYGDVSVATPVMGLKILIVTLLALSASWIGVAEGVASASVGKLLFAALLATLAVAFLGMSGSRRKPRQALFTVATATGAAGCYAVFDFLLQIWGPNWGAMRLMPLVMLFAGCFSLPLCLLFEAPLSRLHKSSWPSIGAGAMLMALQAMFLTTMLATYGHAAEANVLYSTRGLWTVLLVWWLGEHFSREEKATGQRLLARRLLASLMLSIAIALVI